MHFIICNILDIPSFNMNEEAHAASGTTSARSSSTSSGAKRSRTSEVWQHFDKIIEQGPNRKQVTYAKCKTCGNKLSGKSSDGTGHLMRHATSCAKKQGT